MLAFRMSGLRSRFVNSITHTVWKLRKFTHTIFSVYNGICVDCNRQTSQKRLNDYENLKSQIIDLVADPEDEKETYENLYYQAVEVFHPYDKDFVDLLKAYYIRQIRDDNTKRCLEIGKMLLINYYKHLPAYNKLTGLTEMTVAKICTT